MIFNLDNLYKIMFGDFTVILVVLLLLIALVGFLAYTSKLRKPDWKSKAELKLKEIQNRQSDSKFRIIELDKLLEFVFQNHFHVQDSIGTILKLKASQIGRQNLNDIWSAHKLRNHLAHNIDYTANNNEVSEAARIFIRYIREYSS